MSGCGKIRYGTGEAFPSSSVLFTGELPDFILSDSLPCDADLDEVIEKMNNKIQILSDSNDFTELDKGCLDFNHIVARTFAVAQSLVFTTRIVGHPAAKLV